MDAERSTSPTGSIASQQSDVVSEASSGVPKMPQQSAAKGSRRV
jgi:hypothetical protein